MSGIVYCLSRKECDKLAADLSKSGISAGSYHAGLSDKDRESVQSNWLDDRFRVVRDDQGINLNVFSY